jgi:hypothetical protein
MYMLCLRNICINTLHKGDSIFTNNNNNNNNNNNGSRGMGEVAPLYGVDCTGPHKHRCAIVQLEA